MRHPSQTTGRAEGSRQEAAADRAAHSESRNTALLTQEARHGASGGTAGGEPLLSGPAGGGPARKGFFFGHEVLYPYQMRWLNDKSRLKAGMFARQTGKTFMATYEVVCDCLGAELVGAKARWVILSRGERQAREAMEEGVKRHLEAFHVVYESKESVSIEPKPVEEAGKSGYLEQVAVRSLEVKLPGGSRITALPANPDTARGFSASVLLDEFAFHADSRKIWAALFPLISAGHKLRVVSTPNGKANKFHELMTDRKADDPWSRHVVDIHQAVAEGLPRDVELLRRGLGDPDAWAQEYELEWLDGASAWLPYDLLAGIEDERAGDPEGYAGGPTFIGNDIGARRDLWVAWVWERVGDVLWTREVRVLRRASFAEQAATLDELVARYRPQRIAMDQTGMGEAPTEAAKRRHGTRRVEGVLFTADSKQRLATLLKQHAEDRKMRIPVDPAVRADLHSLRRVATPAGNVRFDVHGGSDGKGGGHADRAWAAALGLHAADVPKQPYRYLPVRKQDYIGPNATRDPGPYRIRATAGFVRGVL